MQGRLGQLTCCFPTKFVSYSHKNTFRTCQCSHRLQLIISQLHWSSWGFGGVSTLELISWFWASDHFRGVFHPRKIVSMHKKVFPNHSVVVFVYHSISTKPLFEFELENMEESTEDSPIFVFATVSFIVSINYVEVCLQSTETAPSFFHFAPYACTWRWAYHQNQLQSDRIPLLQMWGFITRCTCKLQFLQ